MNKFKNFLAYHPITYTINRTIIFSLFFIFLSACPGWGATYYVKNGGNDSLAGLSDSTAWATIAKVNSTVKSGDTVYFRSQDTWSASTSSGGHVLTATAGVTYDGSTYGSGTRAKLQSLSTMYSVVKIYASNVTFRGFEVDANNYDSSGICIGSHALASISNITVDNCIVHNTGATDTYYYGIHIGSIDGNMTVSNVTVTNSSVHDCGHEGIAIYPSWQHDGNVNDTILIRNCTIHDTGLKHATRGFGEGLSVANKSDNVTIEYNNIYNCTVGVSMVTGNEGTAYAPSNLIVRYNILHDNISAGIWIAHKSGENASGDFYGNVIYNNGNNTQTGASTNIYGFGIVVDGDGGAFGNSTIINIYNNTIYQQSSALTEYFGVGIAYSNGWTGTPTINFKNNIVNTVNAVVINDHRSNILSSHSNNLIYRSDNAANINVDIGATTYARADVMIWEPTAKTTKPVFKGGTFPTGFAGTYGINMSPNTDYFVIISGDALNSGTTLGSAYNGCINGAGLVNPLYRPEGAYDRGAYQYYVKSVAGTTPSIPLPPKNVRIINQ